MSIAPAAELYGLAALGDLNALNTAEVHPLAFSTATAASVITTSSGVQLTLALTTGYHVGPLFTVQKRRAPVIHGGTLGGKRRRRREKRATPKWADMKLIRALYKEAARMTLETGELHVVDHIVPLDGKIVCGLHWHLNMRVLHWLPNSQKGWGVWPDMPFDQQELFA